LLGSGSEGNSTLVRTGNTAVLLDCGFSLRTVIARLTSLGQDPATLCAIVVTHEHADHIRGVGALARRYGIPVYLTRGTLAAGQAALGALQEVHTLVPGEVIAINDLELQSFAVPHDAREPCQFVFGDGAARIGVLTDTGTITPHIARRLSGCDALLLECNHDRDLLRDGDYPDFLKDRIGSDYGHLANDTAADLLRRIDTSRLQHIVAAHLSQKNNTPELARDALATALDCEPDWIGVAEQEAVYGWYRVSPW
jgi:phosphoribosyl 1,2-cyclic phosphodiesterase